MHKCYSKGIERNSIIAFQNLCSYYKSINDYVNMMKYHNFVKKHEDYETIYLPKLLKIYDKK